MKGLRIPQLCVVACSLLAAAAEAEQTAERTTYDIPLAKLSVSFDEQTHELDKVRISFGESDDYALVGYDNDEYVELTRSGRKRIVHPEPGEAASRVSAFEEKQLRDVVESLVGTLAQFEKDLQNERWGKCLYLDSFLPRFMRGLYFLCEAATAGHDALPRVAKVPESAFDVSLNSPKSDERLNLWRNTPDHVLKLRIMTKELVYQLKHWEKNAEDSRKRDPEFLFDNSLKKAYSLFVRLYFNLKPPPKVSDEEHL